MAVVEYKCDTCKRTIELRRNPEGLERIQRCVITHGCRGKLFQEKLHPDFNRGSIPVDVAGLDNWIPRKVLHNHNQPIEQIEWIIKHDMGVFPVVSVFVNRPIQGNEDNQEEIIPTDIVVIDSDNIKLVFERAYSGIAQLIGRQSDPDLLRPFVREEVVVVEPIQISNQGEITIATRIGTIGENSSINLDVQFVTPDGQTPILTYNADDQPTLDSAWLDYNKIIIKGKLYLIRSFEALTSEMTTGIINTGSTFRFLTVDVNLDESFRDIEKGEMLIMLSTSPYDIVDKQRDRFIDVTDVSLGNNPFSFYYSQGEFFSEEKVVSKIYPLINSI